MSVLVGNVTFYRTLSFVQPTKSMQIRMSRNHITIIQLNLKPKYNSCFYGRILNIRAMFYMAEVLANLKH